jgi:branched-chain amino acid transport system substrate-binding protein
MADSLETPEWKQFVAAYKANFPDGFPSPSLFAYLYYINTEAALRGLDAVKGDLSGGQKSYRDALQSLAFNGPAGEVRIDANRNGVGDTYITEVQKKPDGEYYNQVVKVVPNVSETLGLSKAEFDKMGLGSRDVPNCP